MIVIVPAVGESVPSTMSMVASTGEVAATPVSTQRQYLLVEVVILERDGLAVSNSTRALPVSIVVTTDARVTAVVPAATDAEMSEKYWCVPALGVKEVAMNDNLGVPSASTASRAISNDFKCSVEAIFNKFYWFV